MYEQGNPLDAYQTLWISSIRPEKPRQMDPDVNPYDAFPRVWNEYWEGTVLPNAEAAQQKLDKRMEGPTIWECAEVFVELMKLAHVGPFANNHVNISNAAQMEARQADAQVEHKRFYIDATWAKPCP